MSKPYQLIGLGGTFDHFHLGHQHFINFAHHLADELQIGITTPKLSLHKSYSYLIETYETRVQNVTNFCHQQKIKHSIVTLHDIYGPTLSSKNKIQAIAVTEETVNGADKINQARQAASLNKLPIHICSMLRDQNNHILNSAQIRAGKINRSGQVYAKIIQQNFILNSLQREYFSNPQGKIVKKPTLIDNHQIWLIGDSTLEKFLTHHWPYTLAVYDLIKQRQATKSILLDQIKPNLAIKNPAGSISQTMTQALTELIKQASLKEKQHLLIDGEEDLATVALFLLSPLQTKIYYGQPNIGLIEVEITEKFKNKIYRQLTH